MGKARRRKEERRAARVELDANAEALARTLEANQGAVLEGVGLWGGLSNGRPFAWMAHETKRDTLLRRLGDPFAEPLGPPATPYGLPLLTRVWLPQGRRG